MIVKLFCLSLVLSAIPCYSQVIRSVSDLSNNTKFYNIIKQWSQWPSGDFDWSVWSTPNWRPATTSQDEPSPAPVNQWPTRMPTKYPPLPDWPSSVAPVDAHKPSRRPISWPSTSKPGQSHTSTRRPYPTGSHKPPTAQPPSPNQPDDQTSGNEPFSITVKSCGLSHIPHVLIGNKIVSGKVAKGGEFPWQVILKITTARGPMQCGGSILNSRWILTAAHCVSNERNGEPHAQRVDVTAGIHNRLQSSPTSQARTADCVIQHEGWKGQNGKFKNDIALLRLPADKAIDINYDKGGHVNGVCLPSTPNSEYSGKARISGWGLTKDRGTPSDVLMYTDVSILTNEKCKTYQYPVPIAESMMCQGVDRTAPCQGDSGGPLIISVGDKRGLQRITEIGIVSFGPGQCANPTTPNAIYTKVSYFLKWIEKTIKANAGQKCMARELDHSEKVSVVINNGTVTTPKPISDWL